MCDGERSMRCEKCGELELSKSRDTGDVSLQKKGVCVAEMCVQDWNHIIRRIS